MVKSGQGRVLWQSAPHYGQPVDLYKARKTPSNLAIILFKDYHFIVQPSVTLCRNIFVQNISKIVSTIYKSLINKYYINHDHNLIMSMI